MSDKIIVSTTAAPPPLPQFSQAVIHNGLVFCSGNVGIDPATKTMVAGSVQDRARQVLKNLKAVLEAAGSSLDKVLKVNIYLTDMADFGAFNEVWDEFFTMKEKPARTCVAVHQLPLGTDVEVEATAIVPGGAKL